MATIRRAQKLGKITVEKAFDRTAHPPSVIRNVKIYRWTPHKTLIGDLPAAFSLAVAAVEFKPWGRNFHHIETHSSFILRAMLGGIAIHQQRRTPQFDAFSYRAMSLMFQCGPRIRECFAREFKTEHDLYLPQSDGGGSVLPPDLGLSQTGKGKGWSPRDLIRCGRQLAAKKGMGDSAAPEVAIRLGLLEAAKTDPVDVSSLSLDDARSIVRFGLFDLGPSHAPTAEEIERFEKRWLTALENHVDDDRSTFNRWFEPSDNVIHQISKQIGDEGPIDREHVRQMMLERAFYAFQYVGGCIDIQMKEFAQSFPKRLALNGAEQARWDGLYRSQPWLGGLPLILLHSRFEFLKECLDELAADPGDTVRQGTLLRLLQYYGTMSTARRGGDRAKKRRAKAHFVQGKTPNMQDLNENATIEKLPHIEEIGDIAEILRDEMAIKCRCGSSGNWDAALSDVSRKKVVIQQCCYVCNYDTMTEVAFKKFERLWKSVRSDD